MRISDIGSGLLRFLPAIILPLTAGCLNPNFANSITGNVYPLVPGDTPFVLVRIENASTATLTTVNIVVDQGQTQPRQTVIAGLTPGAFDEGVLFECPVLKIALGDLAFGTTPAIVATFPDGSTSQIPFGMQPLEQGVNYVCGDTIIFLVNNNANSIGGLQISAGRINGVDQPGPFTGHATFDIIQALLLLQSATSGT